MGLRDDIRTQVSDNLGIGNLPPEQQEHIISNLGQVVMERVMLEILKRIPESQQSAFDALADSGDQVGMETFLKQQVPGIDSIVQGAAQEEIRAFKEFMTNLGDQSKISMAQ
jgi:hypothetical protein